MIQKVYPWEVGNLSLINPIKRIRDGIRPLEVMIKALSIKQEPPNFRGERMPASLKNAINITNAWQKM